MSKYAPTMDGLKAAQDRVAQHNEWLRDRAAKRRKAEELAGMTEAELRAELAVKSRA